MAIHALHCIKVALISDNLISVINLSKRPPKRDLSDLRLGLLPIIVQPETHPLLLLVVYLLSLNFYL